MDEKRTEWSSAHAQLWTTFKRQQSSRSEVEAVAAAVVPRRSPPRAPTIETRLSPARVEGAAIDSSIAALQERVQQLESDVKSRDAIDVQLFQLLSATLRAVGKDSGKESTRMLRDELGRRVGAAPLLTDAADEFLQALGALDERVSQWLPTSKQEPSAGALIPEVSSIATILGGSFFAKRLTSESASALGSLNAIAAVLSEFSSPQEASSQKVSPLASLVSFDSILGKISSGRHAGAGGAPDSTATLSLRRVVDLLGGDCGMESSLPYLCELASELALERCKELEEGRREISTLNVVLTEFERVSQKLLQAVGVGQYPTAKSVRCGLTNSNVPEESQVPASKGGEEGTEWLSKRIVHLQRMTREALARHGTVVGEIDIPARKPVKSIAIDSDAKVVRRSLDEAMTIVEDALAGMTEANRNLSAMLDRVLQVAEKCLLRGGQPTPTTKSVQFSDEHSNDSLRSRSDAIIKLEGSRFFDKCLTIVQKFSASGALPEVDTTTFGLLEAITTIVENVSSFCSVTNFDPKELSAAIDSVTEVHRALDDNWATLRELLQIPQSEDDPALLRSASNSFGEICLSVQEKVGLVLAHVPALQQSVAEQQAIVNNEMESAMAKLSQLVVPVGDNSIAVASSAQSLDELVQLLHDRFHQLQTQQLRQHQRNGNWRMERTRIEELVKDSCLRMIPALRKCIQQNVALDSEQDAPTPTDDDLQQDSESLFRTLEMLVISVRSKLQKLTVTQRADKTRIENYQATHDQWSRKFQQITADIVSLVQTVGMITPELKTDDPRGIIKQIAEYVGSNKLFDEAATATRELKELRQRNKEMDAERESFQKALDAIAERVAESGRLVKRVLFSIGCDDSPTDELVEKLLNSEKDNENGEDMLASVLKKTGRWCCRLDETIEEHLGTQRVLAKYFAGVYRAICSQDCEAHDANLLDIDASLIRFADDILAALNTAAFPAGRSSEQGESSTLLGYDHRLARLHDSVCKLNNAIEGLSKVRYMTIPVDEVTVLTAQEPSSPTRGSIGFIDVNPEANAMNGDDLIRIVEKNLVHVTRSLSAFSSSYKHANIILQKDMDGIQSDLCTMLTSLPDLDVESTFGIEREEIFDLYSVMKERSTKQKGCYFFNRPKGEGICPWALATKHLATCFGPIVDALADKSKRCRVLAKVVDEVALEAKKVLEPTEAAAIMAQTESPQTTNFEDSSGSEEEVVSNIRKVAEIASKSMTKVLGNQSVEEECNRLQEQIQVLTETAAITERKLQVSLSMREDDLRRLEIERDQSNSEAAFLRVQLRKLKDKALLDETRRQQNYAPSTGGYTELQGPSPSSQLRASTPKSCPNSPLKRTQPSSIPLSSVEAYMKNLQHELHARHLCESPNHKATRNGGTPKHASVHALRETKPHTMLASPEKRRSHSADHEGCDTCERRARSTSSSRSITFKIPRNTRPPTGGSGDDGALHRWIDAGEANSLDCNTDRCRRSLTIPTSTHSSKAFTATASSPLTVASANPQRSQHHIVVVTPSKQNLQQTSRVAKLTSPQKKASTSDKTGVKAMESAVETIIERGRLTRPREGAAIVSNPAAQVVNCESEGLRKFVQALQGTR